MEFWTRQKKLYRENCANLCLMRSFSTQLKLKKIPTKSFYRERASKVNVSRTASVSLSGVSNSQKCRSLKFVAKALPPDTIPVSWPTPNLTYSFTLKETSRAILIFFWIFEKELQNQQCFALRQLLEILISFSLTKWRIESIQCQFNWSLPETSDKQPGWSLSILYREKSKLRWEKQRCFTLVVRWKYLS